MRGRKQKFGTQFQKNKNGQWELHPIEPATTDSERRHYNVMPLREIKKVAARMSRRGASQRRIGLTRRK
jgi:hypothetical protein